jgi:hypothetical protein
VECIVDSSARKPTGGKRYVTWHRCATDGRDHAITDEDFARTVKARTGQYRAICGHAVVIDSTLMPPGRPCAECVSNLTSAQCTCRTTEPHRGRHRRTRTRRPFCHTGAAASQVPAGAGLAPTVPVPAGSRARGRAR